MLSPKCLNLKYLRKICIIEWDETPRVISVFGGEVFGNFRNFEIFRILTMPWVGTDVMVDHMCVTNTGIRFKKTPKHCHCVCTRKMQKFRDAHFLSISRNLQIRAFQCLHQSKNKVYQIFFEKSIFQAFLSWVHMCHLIDSESRFWPKNLSMTKNQFRNWIRSPVKTQKLRTCWSF